jgi:hypothetical protein
MAAEHFALLNSWVGEKAIGSFRVQPILTGKEMPPPIPLLGRRSRSLKPPSEPRILETGGIPHCQAQSPVSALRTLWFIDASHRVHGATENHDRFSRLKKAWRSFLKRVKDLLAIESHSGWGTIGTLEAPRGRRGKMVDSGPLPQPSPTSTGCRKWPRSRRPTMQRATSRTLGIYTAVLNRGFIIGAERITDL